VRSFDLQTNGNPHVTAADMANLPLPDNSIDIAIFCLALMGTNWVDFVEEAYRILRWKGELWVAEIKSRFTTPGKRGKRVVDHSVGNRRKGPAGILPPGAAIPGPKSKKAKASAAEEAELAEKDLAIEVDGEEDQRQKTDVSAFVDVLAKRGFVLREGGESQAIDLSNKMFVKMYFVKGASPVKGKGVEALKSREGQVARPAKKKFITDEVEMDESAVLKPCVYKIR
jgi:ribosomal RNA-processing protein 8